MPFPDMAGMAGHGEQRNGDLMHGKDDMARQVR